MTEAVEYTIRDSYGNTYGPASIGVLRQWVGEGRVVAGMMMAPVGAEGTAGAWIEVSTHPGLADLLGTGGGMAVVPVQGERVAVTGRVVGPVELGYQGGRVRRHPLAVLSLVAGIASLCGCCCVVLVPVGSVPGVVAVVTGVMALRAIRARPEEYAGGGMAVAGIVLASVNLVASLLWVVWLLVGMLNSR